MGNFETGGEDVDEEVDERPPPLQLLLLQGPNSIGKFWLEFRLEKRIETPF